MGDGGGDEEGKRNMGSSKSGYVSNLERSQKEGDAQEFPSAGGKCKAQTQNLLK